MSICISRFLGSWSDLNSAWLGIKAGDNYANHNHLDLGSFSLDVKGVRWCQDLGADNYALPGYFSKDAQRYKYYRLVQYLPCTLGQWPAAEVG